MNTTRSMVLYALGALVGLGIAGYSLFTAAGTSTRIVPAEDIALVNQRPILRSDFITQLESETGLKFNETSQADRLRVLDEMVREELLVQRGLELDFAETDQTTRNALVAAITQAATMEITTTQPTEAQVRDYYEKNKLQYASDGMLAVRHLLLPPSSTKSATELAATARDALATLRTGTPLEQVMTRYGLIEAKRYDEDYYFAAKYRLGDAVFDAVKNLNAGEFSEPVTDKDGIHIVAMLKNSKPVPLSFEAARTQAFIDYKDATQARLLEATTKFLRSRSKILIAADYAETYKP
jgi:parvulin-like peptidyl-prolyl isomerase